MLRGPMEFLGIHLGYWGTTRFFGAHPDAGDPFDFLGILVDPWVLSQCLGTHLSTGDLHRYLGIWCLGSCVDAEAQGPS